MNAFITLIHVDFVLAKRWFRSQSLSKLVVLLGFFVVFLGVAFLIFTFTKVFFQNLLTYQSFGELTIAYLLHASLILVGWFTIWSALASSLTTLLARSREREFLLTQPISPGQFLLWFSFKTFILTMLLFIMLFSPVLIAFYTVVFSGSFFSFTIASIVIIGIVVLIAHSVGTFIGIKSVSFLPGRGILALVGGIVIFFASAILLLQTIFPRTLTTLYKAEPEDFSRLYQSLPLSQDILPTKWLTTSLINGLDSRVIILAICALILASSIYFYLRSSVVDVLQKVRERTLITAATVHRKRYASATSFLKSKNALFLKEWYSLYRSPSEIGYAIFLFLLFIFFIALFYQVTLVQDSYTLRLSTLLFMYIWFVFFVTAYLLRLVFPLMAREGRSIWYLFTLPKAFEDFVRTKVFFSYMLILPHMLLIISLWLLLPLSWEVTIASICISLTTLVSLVVITIVFGFTSPQFDLADEPEKTTTSTRGIAALLTSVIIGSCGTYLLSLVWQNSRWLIYIVAICALFLLLSLGLQVIIIKKAAQSYNL